MQIADFAKSMKLNVIKAMRRICWVALCALLFQRTSDAAERFTAMFMDETRLEADEIKDWCDPKAKPTLAGRELFDHHAPVRWIVDRSAFRTPPPMAFVEFVGGDRLAGEVLSYQDGQANRFEPTLPNLIVKPLANLQPPEVTTPSPIRITLPWVRRIAWKSQENAHEYQPGTIWLLTGTPLTFRSLRWNETGLLVLTAEGLKQFAFVELSEIHLPQIDQWTAYLQQLAILSPDAKSRLIQMESSDGSRWTTSLERFQARHLGERHRVENWYQLIQPAWSLDPLWTRFRSIRTWLSYHPTEVPLSKFLPTDVQHQAVFGTHFDWQVDQSVLRTPLRSLTQEFGWGWGVQGSTDLAVELPEIASGFRTRYGLDRSVGSGGCIDVRVLVDGVPTALNQRYLTGSEFVGDSHWTDIQPDAEKRHQLNFQTAMAHEGRPAGADPFDIGDLLNWYEPEVRLDPGRLGEAIASHRSGALTGLAGWTIAPSDLASWKTTNFLDETDGRDPQFRTVSQGPGPFYRISQQIKIGAKDQWLAVVASRFPDGSTASGIQIRIDGRVIVDTDVPVRNSLADPMPILVPIETFQNHSILVELIVIPTDANSWVDWRTIVVSPERPGQFVLFEDDPAFAKSLDSGDGRIEVDKSERFSGSQSIKISTAGRANAKLAGMKAEIVEFPRLGQYRYVAFAWKKPSGTRIQLGFANHGRLDFSGVAVTDELSEDLARQGLRRTQSPERRGQKFGYRYEVGVATPQAPAPLWMNGELPRAWRLVERDLYADFGSFVMTGLTLDTVDDNPAWFDHIVLGRTPQDLARASILPGITPEQDESPAKSEARTLTQHEQAVVEFSRLSPMFAPSTSAFRLSRLREHNGQTDVLKTEITQDQKALTLRAAVEVSKESQSTALEMVIGHEPKHTWPLIIRANGEIFTEITVDDLVSAKGQGWVDVRTDLTRFAGQKVLLEVSTRGSPGQSRVAFWKKLELIMR